MRGESLAFRLRGGQTRLKHRRGPYRGVGRGTRPDPVPAPAGCAGHRGRSRHHLGPGPAHHHAGRRSGAAGALLVEFDVDDRAAPPSVTYRNRCGKRCPTPTGTPATRATPGWRGLLRKHPDGDWLASWPVDMRGICRRERPSAGAQLSLLEEADWRLIHKPQRRIAR